MLRAVWSGTISFGLVSVPVKLYNSVRKKTVSFHQLRQSDGCRIRLKKVCSSDGSEVTTENIVKGYEITPDRYVVISEEELQSLYPKASRSIEIEDFVRLEEIDPIYYENSLFVLPDKGGAKTYGLLLTAMRQAGRVAIARFVLRNKEYIAALRPAGQLMGLSTMHFAEGIVPQQELEGLPEAPAELSKRELTMATQLVESLAADFSPEKYYNDYHAKVMDLIERKAEGEVVVAQPEAATGAKVIDLTAALEASLAAVKSRMPTKDRRQKARAQ